MAFFVDDLVSGLQQPGDDRVETAAQLIEPAERDRRAMPGFAGVITERLGKPVKNRCFWPPTVELGSEWVRLL